MTDPQFELGELMARRQGTVDPSNHPNETFHLFSIPAFDNREPEILSGADIGSAKKTVEPGDVLLSRIVPHIRRAWVVPEKKGKRQIASSEWIVFRGNQFFAPYLCHFLTSDQFHIQFMNTVAGVGGSLLRARPDHVAKIHVPLPKMEEQKRIAAILDKADAIRRKRQEAREVAEKFLEATYMDVFGSPVTNPRDWPIEPLGNYLDFLTSGSRGWAQYYVPDGKRFIRSLDVQMNRIGADDTVYVDPPAGTEADRTRVQPQDVLLTITGSCIGRVAFVPPDIEEAYVSQHVAILRLRKELMDRYVSMYLSLDSGGQRQIAKDQYGQTKPGLSLAQIRKFDIPVPPLSEQKRFLAIWDRFTQVQNGMIKADGEVDALFNSLVQRAFKGEL